MAAYRDRVYGGRVIVTCLYGGLQRRVYGARVIVTGL